MAKDFMTKEIKIVIVVGGYSSLPIIGQELHYLNFKPGDVNFIHSAQISFLFVKYPNVENVEDVKFTLHGSQQMAGPYWVGEMGQDMLDYQQKCMPNILGECYIFEESLILAHGIRELIDKGEDYTNPYNLMRTIRKLKKPSCSGTVKYERQINYRDMKNYIIQSIYSRNQKEPFVISREQFCLTCSII